jgi:hypothetical protein
MFYKLIIDVPNANKYHLLSYGYLKMVDSFFPAVIATYIPGGDFNSYF